MTRTALFLRLTVVALLASIALAACGGSTATSGPASAPALTQAPGAESVAPTAAPPTDAPATASAPAAAPDINAAAAALDNVRKYALDIQATGLGQMAAGANEIKMSSVVDRDANAYQYTVSGFSGLEELGGASEISFIVIGDEAWISTGDGNYIKTPGGSAMFGSMLQGLEPGRLLGTIPSASLQYLQAVGQEEKNGVATTHYHLTGADSPQVAEGLGADAVVDLWIADDGGYIVSMRMNGTTDIEGTATPVTMAMDLSRINDASISIEAPN